MYSLLCKHSGSLFVNYHYCKISCVCGCMCVSVINIYIIYYNIYKYKLTYKLIAGNKIINYLIVFIILYRKYSNYTMFQKWNIR